MKKTLSSVLQPHIAFVIIALIFGLLFIKIIPPLWGIDEIVHFNRAYQLSTGALKERKLSSLVYGGKLPDNLISLDGYVYGDLQDGQPGRHGDVNSVAIYKMYDAQHFTTATQETFISGIYPPFAYIAPAAGVYTAHLLKLNIGHTIFAARTFTLFLYIAIVFAALRLLKDSKARWLVFGVALLPMSLFQASIVSVDSLAIGMGILLFSMIIYYRKRDKKLTLLEYAGLLLVAIILTLTKPNYLLFTLAIFCLPASLFAAKKAIWAKILLVASSFLALISWQLQVGAYSKPGLVRELGAQTVQHISFFGQTKFILGHPIQTVLYVADSANKNNWFSQTFGLLGWNYVCIPVAVICLLAILLFIAGLFSKDDQEAVKHRSEQKRFSLILLFLGVTVVLSIIFAFYATYSVVGSRYVMGVQGRYFLPALPFIIYGLAQLLPMRLAISARTMSVLMPGISTFALLVSFLVYYQVTY